MVKGTRKRSQVLGWARPSLSCSVTFSRGRMEATSVRKPDLVFSSNRRTDSQSARNWKRYLQDAFLDSIALLLNLFWFWSPGISIKEKATLVILKKEIQFTYHKSYPFKCTIQGF